jgi:hypothetical protein
MSLIEKVKSSFVPWQTPPLCFVRVNVNHCNQLEQDTPSEVPDDSSTYGPQTEMSHMNCLD